MSDRRPGGRQGERPGRQVAALGVLAAFGLLGLDLLLTSELSLFFDLGFVTLCVAAALAVRRRDFFPVGVLPPLLMFAVVLTLAATDRGAVADEVDGLVQAVVSGLAHHAGALIAGYGLTLAILALRQAASRPPEAQACCAARMSRRSSGGSAKISDSSALCTACASG